MRLSSGEIAGNRTVKGVCVKIASVSDLGRVHQTERNTLALIVAYYISKFNQIAYANLGFSSQKVAHNLIGRILGVNPNTVKNMRDEFDPLHDNGRVGWYQRPLSPSRAKVVELFQELGEEELRDIVLEILTNPEFGASQNFSDIAQPVIKRDSQKKKESVFIVRGPTGRRAEEIFVEYHQSHSEPVPGVLHDRRDYGCGYDFEIEAEDGAFQVEVKGLDSESGGIVFTSKEWSVAQKQGNRYFLVIVRNISSDHSIQIVRNPAAILLPRKNIYTTVQIRWNVSESDLLKLNDGQPDQ